jgi:hypothetical protein
VVSAPDGAEPPGAIDPTERIDLLLVICGARCPGCPRARPLAVWTSSVATGCAAWLPIMGCGAAFALAAIGALVIDHSRPEETGVTAAMNRRLNQRRRVGGPSTP